MDWRLSCHPAVYFYKGAAWGAFLMQHCYFSRFKRNDVKGFLYAEKTTG
jgi:hypothetical protein